MKIGVVISTYNNPAYLKLTLEGFCNQTRIPDEVVIADDGSTESTRILIDSFRDRLPIKHVWHEDRGFQKSEILNKAIVASESEYLIFTDQDCIPREDFVAVHEKYACPGKFISAGYFKMNEEVSRQVGLGEIMDGSVFDMAWLISKGQERSFKMTKLLRKGWYAAFMNAVTPTSASWNGCNSSGWRSDMIAVNGFNEDMHYGGQDREFGERLWNLGLKSIQLRYSAITMHLYHKRPYATAESIAANRAIRSNTRKNRIVRTPHGISVKTAVRR